MKLSLPALSLVVCAWSGCSATATTVRPFQPHGILVVEVVHEAAGDQTFQDGVLVDGAEFDLTEGQALRVRVAPGKHMVRVGSTRTEPGFEVVDVVEIQQQGYLGAGYIPRVTTDSHMVVSPQERGFCAQDIPVEVSEGHEVRAVLVVQPDGSCAPGA